MRRIASSCLPNFSKASALLPRRVALAKAVADLPRNRQALFLKFDCAGVLAQIFEADT
jgi:hypothetical protein